MKGYRAIGVTGGRRFSDFRMLFKALDEIRKCTAFNKIVCGAQRQLDQDGKRYLGADYYAIEYAYSRELPFSGFPAKWRTMGKAAGPIRNGVLIMEPDVFWLVEFPGGTGTADCVDKAHGVFMPVFTVLANGKIIYPKGYSEVLSC